MSDTEFDVRLVIRVATGTLEAAVEYAKGVAADLPLDPGPAHLHGEAMTAGSGNISPMRRIEKSSACENAAARQPCTCGERDHLETNLAGQRALTAKIDESAEKYIDERDALSAAMARTMAALEDARGIIRQWHGMGMNDEAEKRAWEIYYSNSPEMRCIRECLADADRRMRERTP